MADVSQEKRTVAKASDAIIEDIRELHRLETEKRTVPISTDRFHELAEEVTDKSREIMRTAALEETVGNRTETGDVAIDDLRSDGESATADCR